MDHIGVCVRHKMDTKTTVNRLGGLTFQCIPSSISADHHIKLKVSNGMIRRPDASPPAQR